MAVEVGVFCKSFRGDFRHLDTLLQSFLAHNPDGLRLTLSLPAADIPLFASRFGGDPPHLDVVADESYGPPDLAGFRGWHAQQICKLLSHRVVAAESWLVVDADCYFVRDLRAAELRPSPGRMLVYGSMLRTVLKPDNEALLCYLRGMLEPQPDWFPPAAAGVPPDLGPFLHYRDLDPDRPDALERSDIPFKVFGATRWFPYMPGQVFHRDLLAALNEFFAEHGLTAGDAILICPWEYNWYGEFAASRYRERVDFRVSSLLHFQTREDIDFARREGITEALIASRFAAIQMAARHLPQLRFED
jgi:hypothetical protein